MTILDYIIGIPIVAIITAIVFVAIDKRYVPNKIDNSIWTASISGLWPIIVPMLVILAFCYGVCTLLYYLKEKYHVFSNNK